MNLRLAFRVLGHDPVITLVPDPAGDPALLASVEIVVGRTRKPSSVEQELYDAIWERHTDRWPFSGIPLRPGILVEMERAAAREHGWLRILHGTFARRWLNLAAHVDAAIAAARDGRYSAARNGSSRDGMSLVHGKDATGADAVTYDALLGQFRDELAQWTGDSDAGSGIPRAAFGPRPAKPNPPVRDFTLGGSGDGPRARFERHPQLMMLFTDRDEPADWLRAGQALQLAPPGSLPRGCARS